MVLERSTMLSQHCLLMTNIQPFSRTCPCCGLDLFYSQNAACREAERKQRKCWKCYVIHRVNPMGGKHHSIHTKALISKANTGRLCGDKNPSKRLEVRTLISKNNAKALLGHKTPLSVKRKQSIAHIGSANHFYGKRHTEESKLLMRIAALKKLEALGIPNNSDIGADNCFKTLNAVGFNLKPTRFLDVGYIADGYDSNKHIWCEFDTPYHKQLRIHKKDNIRQNNIIRYFESINKPLNGFVRIFADSNGNVVGTKCVYKAKWYHIHNVQNN
jgi:hypothetical protein